MKNRLALYVHYPYCTRICPYCDFNVYRARNIDEEAMRKAYVAQLQFWAQKLDKDTEIASVFFGGGTPSLMAPALIESVLTAAHTHWGLASKAEITAEANPEDITEDRLRAFRAVGVNRLSLGVQALCDKRLKFLGRAHTATQAKQAIADTAKHFPRTSLDIIYATPKQSLSAWTQELQAILALGVPHYSFYQLTIEPKTAFAQQVKREQWQPPSQNQQARLFTETQAQTEQAGLTAYEVSNHAKSATHYCQHNLHIWCGGDYLGIGAGAAGRVWLGKTRYASLAHSKPQEWIRASHTAQGGYASLAPLQARDNHNEALLTGLRLAEGIQRERVPALAQQKLAPLVAQGLLASSASHYRATAKGRLVLDRVIQALAV